MSEPTEKVFDNPSAMGVGDAVGVPEAQETAPLEEPRRCWFVAFVNHNSEKAVRDRLVKLGYEAFVATRDEIHRWRNGKRKKVEVIVITTLVFIRCTEKERRFIVNFPFIKAFLTNKAGKLNPYGGRPLAVIPDRQMNMLRLMLGKSDVPVHYTPSHFSLGDTVRVEGWGEGIFVGHVVRIPGDSANYVGIRIDNLGCAYMEISPDRLEIIK